MTDVSVAEPGEAPAPKGDIIVKVTLPGDITIELNCSNLEDEPYVALLAAGAEAIFRKANGMPKLIAGITKAEGKDLEDRKAKIAEAAGKTLQQLQDGQVPGKRAVKASGAVNTEAMRLAKAMVKDLIRNSGQKIGAYSAKEITAAAKLVLERTPHLLKLAEQNLAKRADEAKGTKGLDLKGLFGAKAESDEVKAKPKVPPKGKAKKGEDKPPLSAKQAGMVAPKAKPAHTTAH